jgi:hypothetical protein
MTKGLYFITMIVVNIAFYGEDLVLFYKWRCKYLVPLCLTHNKMKICV